MMLLSARHLSLGYRSSTIIRDLTLTIESGCMTCLIGPNGSGKSTILYGLGRLLAPQNGALTLDGRDFADWPMRSFARKVAILPQNPVPPEGLTVRDLIGYGRYPHRPFIGKGDPHGQAAIERAIESTDLVHLQHRLVTDLSGGERQRAWIAMALAQEAEILLLDEPTTYLDIRHQLELLELLRHLNRALGLTLVISLHDLGQAARYAHRLLAVAAGQIVADGSPERVLTAELLANVFGVTARIVWDDGIPICLPISAIRKSHTSREDTPSFAAC
jgi:iron complex transport system ATP-binding protein